LTQAGILTPFLNVQDHGCTVCARTIYSYIDQGLIEGVSNESLWEKQKHRKRRRKTLVRKLFINAYNRQNIKI